MSVVDASPGKSLYVGQQDIDQSMSNVDLKTTVAQQVNNSRNMVNDHMNNLSFMTNM